MRHRVAGCAAAAVALAAAAPAQAQLISTERHDLAFRGAVEVELRGTPAAGCVDAGTCDRHVTLSFSPGSGGQLNLRTVRTRSGVRRQADAVLFGFGPGPGRTIAVARRGDATCVDARLGEFVPLQVDLEGDAVQLSLKPRQPRYGPPGDLLRTRCLGPLASDVLSLLPTPTAARSALRDGETLDLTGSWPLTVPGLTGTVTSSLQAVVGPGQPRAVRRRTPRRAPRRPRPLRTITAPVTLSSVTGSLVLDAAGDPASCRQLDACGVTTRTVLTPSPQGTVRGSLFLMSRRPGTRSLRAAIGRGDGQPARITNGGGVVSWSRDAGQAATVALRDGALDCRSTTTPGAGAIELRVVGRAQRLEARLLSPSLGATRCPGPLPADLAAGRFGQQPAAARGSVALSDLRDGRATITLSAGAPLTGAGFTGATRSDLAIAISVGEPR